MKHFASLFKLDTTLINFEIMGILVNTGYFELRRKNIREIEYIASICSISRETLQAIVPRLQTDDITPALERLCRIAISLSDEDDSEKIWNALLDIWWTVYPKEMAFLNDEEMSLLHERSLHKLQSLADAKQINSPEHLDAVRKELGIKPPLMY